MPKSVKPVPEGSHAVTASLCVHDAPKALEFYRKAFGAKELMRMPGPDGKIIHAEIKIGDSIVFVCDEFSEMPGSCRAPQTLKGTSAALYVYVPAVDAVFSQALKAGGKQLMPVTDMFWGDRYGTLLDPFGHIWGLATHVEDPTPEQMKQRSQDFFAASKRG